MSSHTTLYFIVMFYKYSTGWYFYWFKYCSYVVWPYQLYLSCVCIFVYYLFVTVYLPGIWNCVMVGPSTTCPFCLDVVASDLSRKLLVIMTKKFCTVGVPDALLLYGVILSCTRVPFHAQYAASISYYFCPLCFTMST